MLEATHRANRRLCARGASSRWEAQPASAGGRTRRCRGPGSRRSSGGNGAGVGAGGLLAGPGCLSISAVSGKGGGGRAGWRGLGRAGAGTWEPRPVALRVCRALPAPGVEEQRPGTLFPVCYLVPFPPRIQPWLREPNRVVRVRLLLCRCGAGVFHRAIWQRPVPTSSCYRNILSERQYKYI